MIKAFAHTIMGSTCTGLNRALTANRLWECCSIPSILNATETMVISKSTVSELKRIQNMVSRFILQLPSSSSKAMGWVKQDLNPSSNGWNHWTYNLQASLTNWE